MPDNAKVSVIIADANIHFRQAMCEWLEMHDIQLVAQVEDLTSLTEILHLINPNILICDELFFGESFSSNMTTILNKSACLKALVMGYNNNEGLISYYIANGACGFCDKNIHSFDLLITAIQKIIAGEQVILINEPA